MDSIVSLFVHPDDPAKKYGEGVRVGLQTARREKKRGCLKYSCRD